MTASATNSRADLPLAEPDPAAAHDWREAGSAWGHAATDWACLFEHYATAVITAIQRHTGVGPDTTLLDVACGSGLALLQAQAAGATIQGLDASEPLVDIARDRLPGVDIQLGSMYDLPWPAETFDVVTSINGVWGGCDAAVVEAHRVLRSGGWLAISFWGDGQPLDLRPVFKVFAKHAPETHFKGMRRLNDIATHGVAESMLEDAGFVAIERHHRISTLEWPDPEIAWRAISSTGPAVPALEHVGPERLKGAVLDVLEDCRDERGVYRFRNDHQFVLGRRP